mgnify:FL=1|jgi:uncharacterized protein
MIKEIRHKGETSFMLLTSALTLAGVSIISKAYWNTFRAELKTIEIDAPQKMQFERALKVLHLTDIHVEKLSISPEKVVELVDGETFDFIALTGDYLDRIKSIDRFLSFLETLVHIPTRHGLFAVWGNHDWVIADHLPLLKRKMEQLGVQVLANEAVSVTHEGKAIHIIGIDDHHSGHSDVRQAFATVPEHGYRMILTHDPLIVKQKMPAFDYLICGHLHSGQIYYPLPVHSLKWGIRPFRKHLSGLQSHHTGKVYISGGLGQTGANLRLGCRPEITIHKIAGTNGPPVHARLK